MVSPKKAPRTEDVKKAMTRAESIAEYGPQIKKFFPQFDKLTKKQQAFLASTYSIQDVMKGTKNYEKEYSNEAIRKQGLNYLGVETEDYQKYKRIPVGPDGGTIVKKEPLAQGGRVHRGRMASGSAEK
jgi:hypothetical protein